MWNNLVGGMHMIIDVKNVACGERCVKVGTHNGVFHSDEVVAVAILDIAYENEGVQVVRTRDSKELEKCDIVLDIGGGKFDHHMPGFDLKRETGEIYASSGLIWKDFGYGASGSCVVDMGIDIGIADMMVIKGEIDEEYIIPVDLEDNGVRVKTHHFSFIPDFVPPYLDKKADFNKAFFEAEKVARIILKNAIIQKLAKKIARHDIIKQIESEYSKLLQKSSVFTGVIELESQNVPWLETVVESNVEYDFCARFVIFPYPNGGWAAQCVPPALDRKFEQLISFPKEWAGKTDEELQKISGVQNATFCHNGCFFARANCKSAIIDMCIIATQKSNNTIKL